MSKIYDNWERLVAATLKREQLWELFHAPSMSSRASDFSVSSSTLPDLPLGSSNSWYQQNPFSETGPSRWGYNFEAYNFEVEAQVEQLGLGDIIVNEEPLSRKELNMLLNCVNPPKRLKPGIYWYDKFSGFWGKQGHKPSQIISGNLSIGGTIKSNASNGDSVVYINDRKITKVELRVLKLAGVQFYQYTHFWLTEDGSYQEEGRNSIIGNIWGKPGMKLLCSLFSLPFPSKSSHTSGELSVPVYYGDVQKLLLVGCSGSGTRTIFKQAMFLYKDIPFLEDEIGHIKILIQTKIYGYICILLEARQHFEEENLNESRNNQPADGHGLTGYDDASDKESVYSFGPRLKEFSDWLIQINTSCSSDDVFSASFIQASATLFEELWRDSAFQETLKRISELEKLPSAVANYFLPRAVDIFKPDYRPSHMDILYAEGFPSSLPYTEFSFPPPNADEFNMWDPQDYMMRYQLIRSTANIHGEFYWSFQSQDVRMIIFCVSLCDYDQFIIDENGDLVNKMMFNKECFKNTVRNYRFLLLLTKYDLFEEKIKRIPLNLCDWFNDFNPVSPYGNMAEKAFHYVSVKFKSLYRSLTGRKLYVAKVNCLDRDSVDPALKCARDILKWNEESSDFGYEYYSSSEYDESEDRDPETL